MTVSNSSDAAGAIIADLGASGAAGVQAQPEAVKLQALQKLGQQQSQQFDNALSASVAQAPVINTLDAIA